MGLDRRRRGNSSFARWSSPLRRDLREGGRGIIPYCALPEQYALMMKDVLYARKTKIGLEIGEVIVEGEKNATV